MLPWAFFLKRILFLLSLVLFSNVLLAGNFTWKNDAASSEWEDPLNWSGTGVPVNGSNQVVFTSADNITIVSSTNAPVLNSNQTIGAFIISSGSLTINVGNTLTTGSASIAAETTLNGNGMLDIGGSVTVNASIGSNSSGATINCGIKGNIGALFLKNSTFNGVTIFKVSINGNYFNIGGNTFNGVTTFESGGSAGLRLSDVAVDQFNNDLTLISTIGLIYTSYNYNTVYNGNIVVKSTSTNGVYFGNSSATSTVTSTLVPTKTITAQSFTGGTLTLKNFIQQGSSIPQSITLGGTTATVVFASGTGGTGPLTTFDASLIVTAPGIAFNGANFKEDVSFYASYPTTSTGGNVYHKTSYFHYSQTNVNNHWTLGGVNEYKGDATFVNNNVGIIYVGNGTATFGGDATFDNKSTGSIVLAYANTATVNFTNPLKKAKFIVRAANGMIKMADNGATNFYCDVEVNSTGGSIYSVYSGTGKVYLKDGNSISVGELGFSPGALGFKNFIQEGSTPQELLLPCDENDTRLFLQTGCDFSGDLTVQAPLILLQGGIYRGTTDISLCFPRSGSVQSINYEAILFKGDTYIRNKGTGDMSLGNSTFPVTFEGNTYFNITGTGRIYLSTGGASSSTIFSGTDKKVSVNISSANNAVGGTFYFALNGTCEIHSDIELSNNANASIVIGSTNGTVTLAEGKKINILPGAFTFGAISFGKFEQLGDTPQNINLEGSSLITFSNGTIFNGDLALVSPRILLYGGSKFKGITTFEKTSTVTYDNCNGGNEFHKNVTFKKTGSQSWTLCHSGGGDHYYADVTFWNAASANLIASSAGTSLYDGNILFKNTENGAIFIGWNGGIANMAEGKTVNVEGFNSGSLNIRNLNQKDANTSQNIILNPTGTALLNFAGGTEFWGDVTASAPNLAISGIFKGTASFTKTGIGAHSGGPTAYFEKEVTFTNTGTGDFLIGGTDFTFVDNVNLNNNSTGRILVSNSSNQVTNFNGIGKVIKAKNLVAGGIYIGNSGICNVSSNLELSNLSTGGIHFASGVGGQLNLTATSHITASDFNNGILNFRGTKQVEGAPDINLDLQNGRLVFDAGNELYSNITVSCGYFNLNGSKFNGSVNLTSNNNAGGFAVSNGGNTFFSDLQITSTGSNGILLTNVNGDIYKGNVTINKNSAGAVQLARTGTSEFYGNISYNVISGQTPDAFGANGGISAFKGDIAQAISSNYSVIQFAGGGIKMDKFSSNLTLNVPLNVTGNVTFVKGNIIASATNTFSFNGASQIVTGASDQSYIQGVARRFASTAFTFPIGNGGKYMPISISKPSVNEDIRVEAFLDTPPNATTLNNTLSRISSCQYWDVQRVTGSSNISLTIPWASSGCEGINSRDISVAQYKNNVWQFFGANNKVTDGSNGSVTSNTPFTSGYYTFGYIPFDESVFGVLSNKMDGSIYPVKGQKINFRFLEQYKDTGSLKYKIYSNPSELKDEGTITTSYGHNYESIELQTLGLIDGKLYILEVIDEKNRKSYLKFEFKNN